jgi:hypothetical protein
MALSVARTSLVISARLREQVFTVYYHYMYSSNARSGLQRTYGNLKLSSSIHLQHFPLPTVYPFDPAHSNITPFPSSGPYPPSHHPPPPNPHQGSPLPQPGPPSHSSNSNLTPQPIHRPPLKAHKKTALLPRIIRRNRPVPQRSHIRGTILLIPPHRARQLQQKRQFRAARPKARVRMVRTSWMMMTELFMRIYIIVVFSQQ